MLLWCEAALALNLLKDMLAALRESPLYECSFRRCMLKILFIFRNSVLICSLEWNFKAVELFVMVCWIINRKVVVKVSKSLSCNSLFFGRRVFYGLLLA